MHRTCGATGVLWGLVRSAWLHPTHSGILDVLVSQGGRGVSLSHLYLVRASFLLFFQYFDHSVEKDEGNKNTDKNCSHICLARAKARVLLLQTPKLPAEGIYISTVSFLQHSGSRLVHINGRQQGVSQCLVRTH